MPSRMKDLLRGGDLLRVFCTGRLFHPVTIDLFALAGGYHGFWIDQEHAGLTTHDITLAALAGRANHFGTFVRMAPTGYAAVTQALECGVDGVMAAQISSADEAERFVRWAKFAPRGTRGLNTQGADAGYTTKPPGQFASDANRDNFVAMQIETAGALDEVERIAAIDDVDLLFVGPNDLSQALGVIGQPTHEKVWQAIEHIAAACRQHGKPWGIVPPDPPAAERCVKLGCRMLTCGNDVAALRLGVQAIKANFRASF